MFEASGKEHNSNFIQGGSVSQPGLFEMFPGHVLPDQNECRYLLTPIFMIINKLVKSLKLYFVDWSNFRQLTNQDEPCFVRLGYIRIVELQWNFHILYKWYKNIKNEEVHFNALTS